METCDTICIARFHPCADSFAGACLHAAVIAEHKPARLTAIIPADLEAGTYYIEVRTKFIDASKVSKTLKTGRFGKPLTVAA